MNHAEQVLLGHLSETESLDILSREGFHQELSLVVIPTELVRKITGWAVGYYWDNGRQVAPSQEAIVDTWGDQMEAMEITLGDPTEEIDSIQHAILRLRAGYAVARSQMLQKEIAAAIAKADPTEKVAAVQEASQRFYTLSQSLTSRRQESEAHPGFEDSLLRHEERKNSGHMTRGMLLGLPEIDEHTHGVHPGEIAIFGMTTGGGKSWLAGRIALQAWERGRRAILYTMENDLPMTFDRLVCMQARVPYGKYQEGAANEGDLIRIMEWTEKLKDSEHQPVVIQPDIGERDPVSLVRKAFTLGGEDLILDQLSHMEAVPGTKSKERNYQVAEILRVTKNEISTGADTIPTFLLAQINRAGRQNARRAGRYEFEDFALSSEVENIADYVAAAYQSDDNKALQRALWQELKFRRGVPQDWILRWRLEVGDIRVLSKADEEAPA